MLRKGLVVPSIIRDESHGNVHMFLAGILERNLLLGREVGVLHIVNVKTGHNPIQRDTDCDIVFRLVLDMAKMER